MFLWLYSSYYIIFGLVWWKFMACCCFFVVLSSFVGILDQGDPRRNRSTYAIHQREAGLNACNLIRLSLVSLLPLFYFGRRTTTTTPKRSPYWCHSRWSWSLSSTGNTAFRGKLMNSAGAYHTSMDIFCKNYSLNVKTSRCYIMIFHGVFLDPAIPMMINIPFTAVSISAKVKRWFLCLHGSCAILCDTLGGHIDRYLWHAARYFARLTTPILILRGQAFLLCDLHASYIHKRCWIVQTFLALLLPSWRIFCE